MQDLGVSAEVLAPTIPDRSEAVLYHSNAIEALASTSNIRCPSVCKSDRSTTVGPVAIPSHHKADPRVTVEEG